MRQAHDRAKLTTAVGILTMLFGAMFILAPAAGAQQGEQPEHKVTICHRTNSVTNPYVQITVDYDGADGSIEQGPDHYVHTGPVFDFDADPDVAYPPPHNGDQWGDIIPPVALDGGGETEGLNWAEGEAIWDNGCAAPDVDEVCEDDLLTEEDECNPDDPDPDPASLTIEKVVEGDDAPDDWSFDFEGDLSTFTLTDEDPDTESTDLEAGEFTITETDAGDADLTEITCTTDEEAYDTTIASDGSSGSVTVDLAEGDDVTCTFTNTFPDVEGSVVTNPPRGETITPTTPPTPPAGPKAEVLGEQVVRTLPRTGSTNGPLAVLGVALLLVGATLVGGSRLRLRYVD